MDAFSPPTLPGNPFSWRPPAAPTPAGGPPPRRMLTDPSLPWGAPGSVGSSAGPTRGNCTKHRPRVLPTWSRPARPPHGRPTPLWRDSLAAPPFVRLRWGSSAQTEVTGTRPHEAGCSRSAAPTDPAWPRLPGHNLRFPQRPSAQSWGSDPAGGRALAGGVQAGAHMESRPCTHVRAQGVTDQEEGPGGSRGGTWVADSARRGSEGHMAHLPGGEGRPSPQPSHQGVCRPGVPHTARVTRAAESGCPQLELRPR